MRPAIMVIASGSESEGESPVPRGPGAQPPSPALVPQDKHPAPVTLPGDGQRSEDGDDGDGAARHSITTDQTEGNPTVDATNMHTHTHACTHAQTHVRRHARTNARAQARTH